MTRKRPCWLCRHGWHWWRYGGVSAVCAWCQLIDEETR